MREEGKRGERRGLDRQGRGGESKEDGGGEKVARRRKRRRKRRRRRRKRRSRESGLSGERMIKAGSSVLISRTEQRALIHE